MSNWWNGSKKDSERQASERNSRSARRYISNIATNLNSSVTSNDFFDCGETPKVPNLDGGNDVEDITDETIEPPVIMSFEDEKGTGDTDYYKKLGPITNRLFNKKEPEFWFTGIESSLKHVGV